VLNYEKYHFMVSKGIVLGHLISERGMQVDKVKINIITSLTYPSSVREVRLFLGHVGFYRRFIKYFSQIVHPLSSLWQKMRCLNLMIIVRRILMSERKDLPVRLLCSL